MKAVGSVEWMIYQSCSLHNWNQSAERAFCFGASCKEASCRGHLPNWGKETKMYNMSLTQKIQQKLHMFLSATYSNMSSMRFTSAAVNPRGGIALRCCGDAKAQGEPVQLQVMKLLVLSHILVYWEIWFSQRPVKGTCHHLGHVYRHCSGRSCAPVSHIQVQYLRMWLCLKTGLVSS